MTFPPNKKDWADITSFITILVAAIYGAISVFRPNTNLAVAIFIILVTFVTTEFLKNSLLNDKIAKLAEPQTVRVQSDRRSNYDRGAGILNNATPSDTIWLSFLEHSSMWVRDDQFEDKIFDEALDHAIQRNCSICHVIRCDRSVDLEEIVTYVSGFDQSPNYYAFVMTRVDHTFHPLDVLVIRGKVAQIEFPQPYTNPIRMGPSLEVNQAQAVQFVEEYARLLVATSMPIKDQNGINPSNVEKLRATLKVLESRAP
jgi:hypothetical protein